MKTEERKREMMIPKGFIELTSIYPNEVKKEYIRVSCIVRLHRDINTDITYIWLLGNGFVQVEESVEEVMEKIIEEQEKEEIKKVRVIQL